MKKKERILIVDDEKIVRESLFLWFEYEGYKVEKAENSEAALSIFEKGLFDLAFIDMKMPGMNGLELLKKLKELDDDCIYILITAYASESSAIIALKDGAFDYITKPVDPDNLSQLVQNALEQKKLKKENMLLRDSNNLIFPVTFAGESKQMKKIKEIVGIVASSDSTILMHGESGTGKELVANTIHLNSKRKFFPFVVVNCKELSESNFEKELLGFEKLEQKHKTIKHKGKFELAKGGTIFLKNINTLPLKIQKEFLKLIDEKKYHPVGSNEMIKSEFRIFSSTSESLDELVKKKKFNKNLYDRLNKLYLNIPPLRDRLEDIPILAYSFFKKYCSEKDKVINNISPEAMKLLCDYDWHGNVIELKNTIEKAVTVAKSETLKSENFPINLRSKTIHDDTDQSLDTFEKKYIEKILKENGWNISRSAEILNIDRVTLYSNIKKYGLVKNQSDDI